MENFENAFQNATCTFQVDMVRQWFNGSNWTRAELIDYACAYWTFKKFQRRIDYFKAALYLNGGIFGILSAILALLTFSQREFGAASFLYHRAINAVELPFMVLMIERSIRDYMSPAFLHSYYWSGYAAVFGGKIDNALPTMVNVITLFVAVERAVACSAPRHFVTINRPCVVWSVVFGAFCISVAIWTPACFFYSTMFDNRTAPVRYMPVLSRLGRTSAFNVYSKTIYVLMSTGAALMLLATATAVVGLRRTAARSLQRGASSRTLMAAAGAPAPNNEYWSLLKQLSYLQLCETVPLIVLHALYILAEHIHWNYGGGGLNAPYEVTFQVAMHYLSLAKMKQLSLACLDVSNVAAHCFHFYWYLLFCPKVRRGFISCIKYGPNGGVRRKSKSGATTADGKRVQEFSQTIFLRQPLFAAAPSAAETALLHKSSTCKLNGTLL